MWLMAGGVGRRAGNQEAAAILEHAAALDPLAATAPFERLRARPDGDAAPCWGARALLAEPRLLGATWWRGHEQLRAAAVRRVETWPGIDEGWRAALADCASATPQKGPAQELGLDFDSHPDPARSFSLHAFRRARWPATLAPAEVVVSDCALILPPATILSSTSSEAIDQDCAAVNR